VPWECNAAAHAVGATLIDQSSQVARVWGFAIAALPDILNLTIVAILLYAAVISCGPIFNELLWTPDDADRPPIEGRKWSDFDKPMQDILRTYKNGDVAPSGDHIEGWNRCIGHAHSAFTQKPSFPASNAGPLRKECAPIQWFLPVISFPFSDHHKIYLK
jgi:hypothetical protein